MTERVGAAELLPTEVIHAMTASGRSIERGRTVVAYRSAHARHRHRVGLADGVDEPAGLQLVGGLLGQTVGNVAGLGKLGHRVGLQSVAEPAADDGHHQHAREVAETVADVVDILAEVVLLDVLADVGELDAEEDDAPGDVDEEEQQRDGGECSVDGVVGRDVYLDVDIEVEERLEGEAGDEARDDGVAELDLRVGEEDVHGGEDESCQHVGRQFDNEVDKCAQEEEVAQVLVDGAHKDTPAAEEDDEQGQQEEHGEVVGNLAEVGALLAYTPYLIEALLDISCQADDCPEQDDEADADEDAAVGVLEV